MYYLYSLLSILFFFPVIANCQITRLKEGSHLYENYQYIDAQKIYEIVVSKGYQSAQIYGDLADSYYYQSNYKTAAKWYDLLLQKYPREITQNQFFRAIQSFKSNQEYDRVSTLLAVYASEFGSTPVTKRYEADPNYLKSILDFSPKYTIEKLGINTKGSDHSPMFLGNTKIVFASSDTHENKKTHSWDGGAFLDLFVSDRDRSNGRLRNKRPIKGDINTHLHEAAPVFTKDGKTMYFTRNNIKNGKTVKDAKDVIRLRIFKAELQAEDTWKVVEDLAINGDDYSTAYPALNHEENKLYFSSDREGSIGMSDIWFIDRYPDGSYGYPVHLGEIVNTEGREAFLFIDSENVLYFASDGHLGLGGLDIFKTRLDVKGMPSTIENIGEPFNSPQDDFGYIIDKENNQGYFTTNRDKGGSINDNLYYFYQDCYIEFNLTLKDAKTNKTIDSGLVEILNQYQETIYKKNLTEEARYSFKLNCNTNYFLSSSNKRNF